MRKSTINRFSDLSKSIKRTMAEEASESRTYPVTIVGDRYGGAYSGSPFMAVYANAFEMPDEIGGSDSEEMNFWRNDGHEDWLIGKGKTPNEAYDDLIKKIIEFCKE